MTILILDDEILICQELQAIAEEAAHGIHKIVTNSEPYKVFDLINRLKPEIILTDIQMPGISGIDFAHKKKKKGYHSKIIFITGHAQFEYAQAAIQYQVSEYILKPINEEETLECIKRAITEYSEEKKHEDIYQLFQNYFVEHSEIVRQQFMEKLFFQPMYFNQEQLDYQKKFLMADLKEFRVVAMSFVTENRSFEEESYYGYSIWNYFQKKHNSIPVYRLGEVMYFIWSFPETDINEKKIFEEIEAIKCELEQLYPVHLKIGISQKACDLIKIQELKKQVLYCLEYGKTLDKNIIIRYEELPEYYSDNSYFDMIDETAELISFLRKGDKVKALWYVDKILSQTQDETEEYSNQVIDLIVSNVNMFLSGLPSFQREAMSQRSSAEEKIHVQSSFKLKQEYLIYWVEYIADCISNQQNGEQNILIQSIYDYINTHYSEPIGLTNVSDHINRNPSYVSRLIKQNTGKNYSQILMEKRMEEAKRFLRTTTLKISQISEQVGYPNVQYFTKVFTDYSSITPGEYRKITTYF